MAAKILLGLALVLAVSAHQHKVVEHPTPKVSVSSSNLREVYAPGDIMFEDNFDTFNLENWQHEVTMSGGGNWEFQVYSNTRQNSYVRNGVLHIKPTLTNDRFGDGFVESGSLSLHGGSPADECTNPAFWGCERTGSAGNVINPTMSARVRTTESFNFRYGRVDVRAKIPAGDWLWPAIWMMPRYNQYGTWPASGEIDIMESRGNLNLMQNGVNIGSEQVSCTMHYGPYWPYNGYENAHFSKQSAPGNGFDKAFHVYSVEWTPQHVRYFIDNEVLGTVSPPAGGFWELGQFPDNIENPWQYSTTNPRMAPFDEKYYLILNLAVGGTNGFFPDNVTPPKPWSNEGGNAFSDFWNARGAWFPTWQGENSHFQIDYVRVTAV